MFGVAADTGTALGVAFDGDGGCAEAGALDGYGATPGPDVPDQVSRSRTEAREHESTGRRLRDHARAVLELLFGERPPRRTPETRGDPTPFSRHHFFVEHEYHVRVFPLHADDRACVAVEDPLGGPTELLRDYQAATQIVERFREFGRSKVGGGQNSDLRVGAADVDGETGVATVGADRNGIVPREPGTGERHRDRGEARQDPQVFPPEPFAKEAHDAEETRVPGREHYHRTFCICDPRERLREVSL